MAPSAPGPTHRVVDRLPPDLAEKVADEIRRSAGDAAEVRLGDAADRHQALVEEQQRDYDEVIQGPPISVAPMAGSQARGAIAGALTFGAVGLVVGLLIGLIPMFDLPLGARMGLWALVCTMGASASGFVFGGGREPELEGKLRDSSTDVTVAVESADERVLERARELIAAAEGEVADRARRLARQDRASDHL